jgi:hypothetical protein
MSALFSIADILWRLCASAKCQKPTSTPSRRRCICLRSQIFSRGFSRINGLRQAQHSALSDPANVRFRSTTDSCTAAKSISFQRRHRAAEQKIGLHRTFTFDDDAAVRLKLKALMKMSMGRCRNLNTIWQAVRFHATGDVHRVAPDIVNKLVRPDDPSHHLT